MAAGYSAESDAGGGPVFHYGKLEPAAIGGLGLQLEHGRARAEVCEESLQLARFLMPRRQSRTEHIVRLEPCEQGFHLLQYISVKHNVI